MSDIYCGINKTPKGQRLGTMKECAEKGQIRRFGINKIDKKTLELAKKKDVIPETREKLIMKMASLRGSIRKYKGRYETTKDKDAEGKKKKEDYRKLWVKAENDLKKVITKLQKVEKERDALKKKPKIILILKLIRKKYQERNLNQNQRLNQDPKQELRQNPRQQYLGQDLRQDPSQNPSQNLSQELSQNPRQNLNRNKK